jgi:hypothetical protein
LEYLTAVKYSHDPTFHEDMVEVQMIPESTKGHHGSTKCHVIGLDLTVEDKGNVFGADINNMSSIEDMYVCTCPSDHNNPSQETHWRENSGRALLPSCGHYV